MMENRSNMSAMGENDINRLPLPAAGLAGQLSFTFYWAHRYSTPSGWVLPPPQYRPYATLWLLLDGNLHVATGSGAIACGPGCLVAWPPEVERGAENRSKKPAMMYTMAFNLQVWGEVDFFRFHHVPTIHQSTDTAALAEPFSALVDELAAQNEAVTLAAEGWARVLVGRWLSELQAAGKLQPSAGADERLAAVLTAIEADLSGCWSQQRIADMMRLSKVRMRELFVRTVGIPPMRYITLRRLDHARNLLSGTGLTCAQIAECCGFQDPGYFSRMFHRVVGMQPLAYREQTAFLRDESGGRQDGASSGRGSAPAPRRGL